MITEYVADAWNENSEEMYAIDAAFDDLGSEGMAQLDAVEANALVEGEGVTLGSDDNYGFTPFGSEDLAAIANLDPPPDPPRALWHDGNMYYFPHYEDKTFDNFVNKGVSRSYCHRFLHLIHYRPIIT